MANGTITVDPQELDAQGPAPSPSGVITVDPSQVEVLPPKPKEPARTYSLSDLATPGRTALGPGVSARFEQPYTSVRGMFGEPELSEASKQRLANEQIEQGSIRPGESGVGGWLQDLESDIRHGTGATAPGRALRAMGAPGTESGVPHRVAETIGGPFVGPIRAAYGFKKALGPYAGEPANFTSELRGLNEGIRGVMQTAAPVVAATQPEFIPTMTPYAIAGEAGQRGLEKAGVSPDVAEFLSNVALLGGGAALASTPERAPFGGVYENGAREPVVAGDTVPDYLSRLAEKTGRAVRVNAPIELPKLPETTEGPAILSGAPQRSPIQELAAQADEARGAQAFRQQLTNEISEGILGRLRDEGLLERQPAMTVIDRRAVKPENIEPYQPPRRFIGSENIPPAVVPSAARIEPMIRSRVTVNPDEVTPAKTAPKMLPSAPPEAMEGAQQAQDRFEQELAQARTSVKPREPLPIATPSEISADSKRVGYLFAGRMGNPIERQYTNDLWRWMLDRKGPEPEPPPNVGPQRAGIIRDRLAEISQGQFGNRVPNPSTVFAPDVLDEAKAMMAFTHDFLSQQERPGRYRVGEGEMGDVSPAKDRFAFYGIKSLRNQFPWFANLKESPGDLAKALKRGEGPAYDRLVTAAADHIMRSREENARMARGVEPNLEDLANEVGELDPDLAAFLADAAQGKISSWTETKQEQLAKIEEKIADARQAIQFGRAVDDLAAEERASGISEANAGEEETLAARNRESAGIGAAEAPQPAPAVNQPQFASRSPEQSEPEGVLPGMGAAVREQERAAGIAQAERLSNEMQRPPESIEGAAGTMERESPLFRGTEASPQREIFGPTPQRAMIVPEADPERTALLARLHELEQQLTPPIHSSNADALRRAAESLTSKIEAKKNPAISSQNPTARRARIADNMYREAEAMEQVQRVLRGMADASEAGELPEILTKVRSRALVEDLLRREKPPRARLRAGDIRELIEKTKTHPGMAAARSILSRTLGRGDFPELYGNEETDAAGRLMDVAEQRGLRTTYMREELQDYKRAAAAGIESPDQWSEARKAVLGYAGQEPPRGVERQIKEAERELLGTKIPGYFPTPKTLASRLVDMADIEPGDDVLEPSAGTGSIADAIRQKVPEAKLDTVETQDRLRKILKLKGHNIAGRDFLEHNGEYDKIVMNPPFEEGQDIEHVRHAYDLLKPGGKLVAVMSEGPFFRNDAKSMGFRDWLNSVGGESEKLPPASFTGKEAQRQTGVSARVVTIEKPRRYLNGEAGFITPELARELFTGHLSKEAYRKYVAKPIIEKGLGLGDKYAKVEEADPSIAAGLHMLDNAPAYFRAKGARMIENIIGGLSRQQERLFTLLADADSRENLQINHPDEYRRAMNDPAIQEALRKYRPIERELTAAREKLQGQTLDQDYLRRVYEQHVAGIGKEQAPGSTRERGTTPYDRVVRPQRVGNLGREATAEYHYEHGLHEFGPAFGTKYIGTNLAALRDSIARDFISKATEIKPGDEQPRSISYNGKRYYRPDIARDMREAGQKNVKTYDLYDPNAGVKYPQKGQGLFLGPSDVVRALNDYGTERPAEPGPVRRFLQEQTIGFGFGIPHVANILRRVTQSVPLGAVNPEGWVRAWQVAFGKELRERGMSGIDDPTFDRLMRQGSITTGEMANLKRYWGGNLNPANWARSLAGIGHKLIFEPGSFGGLGGVDQRARLYVADLVKSQQPELSDAEIARAVNTQLGDYNSKNWNERQKLVSRFMLFPGWDTSSIRWVIEHPIKTTVPPAVLVLLANQALNRLGYNRDEDATDISNIHFGDRSIGLTILRESMARNLARPVLNYAQSRISGESNRHALGEISRGIRQEAGGLVGTLRPDLTAAIDIAMNRESPFGGQELVSQQDYNTPGGVLPNRALEKQAALVVRHAIPPLDRMLGSDQSIDFAAFAGSNVGLPNYKYGAEQRLRRNAAESLETAETLSRLARTNPAAAREFVKDPDDAAYALFHRDFEHMSATLKRINAAKEAVSADKDLSAAEKSERLARIEKARQNLLRNADGLDRLLFERKQELRSRVNSPAQPAPLAGIRAAAGASR